jgi:DNA (cytosine-5)-methyltransferase 1
VRAYYNEFDKKKCAALYQLMKDGHITKGDIDDRSIHDVQPADVRGYDRCHFFAGIGLWDYALQLAGWEDQPVWTGSCPCQPYSTAGKQRGKADDRHLWPEWLRLIKECRPSILYGEQVADAIAFGWLDDVYQGLEAEGYAVGSSVLPACSVGAPHKRDRLWFVGNAEHDGSLATTEQGSNGQTIQHNAQGQDSTRQCEGTGYPCNVADSQCERPQRQGELQRPLHAAQSGEGQASEPIHDCSRHWQDGQWIDCPDGKQRLIEPSIPLLAHGYEQRVGVIHAAGDGIVPQVAARFIQATM